MTKSTTKALPYVLAALAGLAGFAWWRSRKATAPPLPIPRSDTQGTQAPQVTGAPPLEAAAAAVDAAASVVVRAQQNLADAMAQHDIVQNRVAQSLAQTIAQHAPLPTPIAPAPAPAPAAAPSGPITYAPGSLSDSPARLAEAKRRGLVAPVSHFSPLLAQARMNLANLTPALSTAPSTGPAPGGLKPGMTSFRP